ncbi:MAG: EthD family reductase [Chloroflexota bacterium]|nr:EthD family reductase [Chloroflexota bacterium]
MFNVVFLVKRRPDLSPEEFARYWVDDHTPLTANVPGIRAYKLYTVTGLHDGEPVFDGVAILSFDDRTAHDTAIASPEFAAAIADAPNFQDVAVTTSFFGDEHVIV